MTPAPMKRTSCAQTVMARPSAPASAGTDAATDGTPWATAQAANSGEVRIGTKISQAKTRPNSWVRPTARPIRWPAPSRANCMEKPTPVAPPPSAAGRRRKAVVSAAKTRAAARKPKTAEAIAPPMTTNRPERFSRTASWVCSAPGEPTFSTSAAATPSG
ncbi:hypothetical protein D3C77_315720 [compost metagenome]